MVRRAYDSPVFERAVLRLTLLVSLLFASLSCKHERASAGDSDAHRPKLSRLQASSWLVDLDVAGFGKSAVAVPLGANGPRPIVIALHGSADRPEWACAALRSIAGPAPFVLCPRGVARADFGESDPRYTFGSADDTASELRASLGALKARFGPYVASGPVIFTGFEVGADHVASIAAQEPSFFSRLLLIEPSANGWSSSRAAMFGRAGGQRVLFAFGPAHRDELEQRAVLTSRAGAEARAVFLGPGPVTLDPVSRRLLLPNWAWLAQKVRPGAASLDNVAGNPLPAGRPKAPKPIDL